jgi:threonine dehydratase
VCAAIKDAFEDTRRVLEPAGAMGIAGLKSYAAQHGLKDKTLIAVTCGANLNFDRLRFIAERAETGEEREALFAVSIPEERGSFKRLCQAVGDRNVTEFNYRISEERAAHVLVGVTTTSRADAEAIQKSFEAERFTAIDLVDDDLAKEHLRYMIGGRSELAVNEQLYRFQFPERPGALMRFLSSMHPNWNITLFHYRNQGADYGRILVGIQLPAGDDAAFREFIEKLGYPYVDETDNRAYRLFLR